MKTNPEDLAVQQQCISILTRAADKEQWRAFSEAGGIAVVLEALRTYQERGQEDVEVQRRGLRALWNLAVDGINKRS